MMPVKDDEKRTGYLWDGQTLLRAVVDVVHAHTDDFACIVDGRLRHTARAGSIHKSTLRADFTTQIHDHGVQTHETP